MKASDLFVKCLENEGVKCIFGLPGEENADLMMSLKNSSIKFVLCRHEQTAAFMADVHGRLTGKAGVCLASRLQTSAGERISCVDPPSLARVKRDVALGTGDRTRWRVTQSRAAATPWPLTSRI